MTLILGISGSLRRHSHNTSLLRAAAETAGSDVELELYDGLKEVRPYDEIRANLAEAVDALAAEIRRREGMKVVA